MPPHTILLSGNPIYAQEKLASVPITPGHLVEVVPSGGDAGQLRLHSTAGGDAQKAFAYESLTPATGVATQAIDTPYPDGDSVRWLVCRSGDCVYAWLPAAAAAVIDGDPLESNGDGTLRKGTAATATEHIVGWATEAVNNSGGGAPARIRVRVA